MADEAGPSNAHLMDQEVEEDDQEDIEAIDDGVELSEPARKRLRGGSGAFESTFSRAAHPGFFHTEHIRLQHVTNLVTSMRHLDAIRDDATLAAVLATLLQAESPEKLALYWQFRQRPTHARYSEVLLTAIALLRRHPNLATPELIQRFIRRARVYQSTVVGRAKMELLLAEYMVEAGLLSDAHDLATSMHMVNNERGGNEVNSQRKFIAGRIRHRQWSEAMQDAAAARLGKQKESKAWDPFSHDAKLLTKAGRNTKYLSEDAQKSFRECLGFDPYCTSAAMMVFQIALVQGKPADALLVAREQCARAPCDMDAHAACLALLVSGAGGSSRREGRSVALDTSSEVLKRCSDILHIHPGCEEAIQVLISLAGKHPSILLENTYLECLCVFIDTTPPSLACNQVQVTAWGMMCDSLTARARVLVECEQEMTTARRALRTTRATECTNEEDVDMAASALAKTVHALHNALERWEAAGNLLRQREWWLDCHLQLPRSKSSISHLLSHNQATIETFSTLAIAQGAMYVALQAYHLRRCRATGYTAPQLLESSKHAAPAISKAIREFGDSDTATSILSSIETLRSGHAAALAAEESAVEGTALGVACTRAVSEQGHYPEQDTRGVAPGIGWDSIPLGGANPDIGHVSPLASAWWRAFPQVQRRARQEAARESQLIEEEQQYQQQQLMLLLQQRRAPESIRRPALRQRAPEASPVEGMGSQPSQLFPPSGAQRRVRFAESSE